MTDDIKAHKLGVSEDELVVADPESSQTARLVLAQQAKTSIHIFEPALRDELYRQQDFIDAVRDLISNDTHSIIKVLVNNIEQAMRNSPQLFALSRRVPSHVQIRLAPQSYHHYFFVADATGYLDHRMGTGYESEVHFNHPAKAKSLINFFDKVWGRSSSPSESRNLSV
ncbi:MAG: hypothetical protein OQK73_00070 [Gammaproteobacteria bacterium]|nr:hypothetical protein [Gammaproteobacteria bacterium]